MDRNASRISRSALLATLVLSSLGAAIPAYAADGIIVITRDVQPRIATRPALVPDPDPRTVNANPSSTVIRATSSYELTDADFAGVTSGSSLQRQMLPGGQLPGLGNSSQASAHGLPGMRAGQGGGAGSSVSNQINRSLQQGLAPLKILTGDR
ncbi:hypothetical protein SAMN05216229_106213 [Geopseudomonas sagittaria]|uniref:Uncharacterized protein n=1 Tax=Geopseudomonas sagittaria TaxID=1135990 RepID=A0A1I5TNQ2_9GAMM|nr:hypothetical protein [Pseudomonas sagittaria]MCM2329895.1 hypothetical protein [Pseudomonas sagittaria]SFP84663.1 hypothetical protein SAMN05216229_106213 [Pseudomonas sagittaria]